MESITLQSRWSTVAALPLPPIARAPSAPGRLLRIAAQVGALWAFSAAGNALVETLHLPVPGNVLGMALIYGALSCGLIRERWFAASAPFLTKHIAFFFIPLVVGVVDYGLLLVRAGFAILVTLVASTMLGILVTALVGERLTRAAVA